MQNVDANKMMRAFDFEDQWIATLMWLHEEFRWNVSKVYEAMRLAGERGQRVTPTGVRLALQYVGALYGFEGEG